MGRLVLDHLRPQMPSSRFRFKVGGPWGATEVFERKVTLLDLPLSKITLASIERKGRGGSGGCDHSPAESAHGPTLGSAGEWRAGSSCCSSEASEWGIVPFPPLGGPAELRTPSVLPGSTASQDIFQEALPPPSGRLAGALPVRFAGSHHLLV